jgi:hypothetical protein
MLIISKKCNKDYYDGVVGTMGIDKTLVYNREPIEIEDNDRPSFFRKRRGFQSSKSANTLLSNFRSYGIEHDLYEECGFFIIGFCGKLYVGWKVFYKEKTSLGHDKLKFIITYDFKFIEKISKPSKYRRVDIENNIRLLSEYDASQLFIDCNVPVFVYDNDYRGYDSKYRTTDKFIINPNLKTYEFYKVFDSFSAFQEISMYIGGVLGRGEKEIIEVDDKYKIEQHGFNKWSFRKEPKNDKK